MSLSISQRVENILKSNNFMRGQRLQVSGQSIVFFTYPKFSLKNKSLNIGIIVRTFEEDGRNSNLYKGELMHGNSQPPSFWQKISSLRFKTQENTCCVVFNNAQAGSKEPRNEIIIFKADNAVDLKNAKHTFNTSPC